jgi:integrase/recombinase XerD
MMSREKSIKRLLSSEIFEDRGEEKEILAENLETLRDFDVDLVAEGISDSTRYSYTNHLRSLALYLEKPLKDASKRDLKRYFASLNGKYEKGTLKQIKIEVKRFYRWLYDLEDEYPECVKWIKTGNVDNDLTHDQLVTEDELKALVEVARNPRDRAMIQVTYEGALRKGELMSLKVKNVEITKYGVALNVNGKTGVRRIPLINSAPSLQMWLSHHPNKDNPEAYLWVPIGTHKEKKTLNYSFFGRLLKRLSSDAGLKKKVYPHLLRHSQLTKIAKKKSDSVLKGYAGWTGSSRMPRVYVHLSNADIEREMLEFHGVAEEEEEEPSPLKPRDCPRCGFKNPAGSRYCARCSLALDPEAYLEAERERQEEITNLKVELDNLKDMLKKVLEAQETNSKL